MTGGFGLAYFQTKPFDGNEGNKHHIIYIYISIFDGHGFENSIYCVLMDILCFHCINIWRTWIWCLIFCDVFWDLHAFWLGYFGGKCVAKYSSTMWHTGMLYVLALLRDVQGHVVQYTMHEWSGSIFSSFLSLCKITKIYIYIIIYTVYIYSIYTVYIYIHIHIMIYTLYTYIYIYMVVYQNII